MSTGISKSSSRNGSRGIENYPTTWNVRLSDPDFENKLGREDWDCRMSQEEWPLEDFLTNEGELGKIGSITIPVLNVDLKPPSPSPIQSLQRDLERSLSNGLSTLDLSASDSILSFINTRNSGSLTRSGGSSGAPFPSPREMTATPPPPATPATSAASTNGFVLPPLSSSAQTAQVNSNTMSDNSNPVTTQADQDTSFVQLLDMMVVTAKTQQEKLEEIAQQNRTIANGTIPDAQTLEQLGNVLQALRSRLHQEIATLNELFFRIVFPYPFLMRVHWLLQEFMLQQRQLELFILELNQVLNGFPVFAAALIIVDQPFPLVINKNAEIEQPLLLHVLKGAGTTYEFLSFSEVVANGGVQCDPPSSTVEPSTRNCRWHMKLVNETRSSPVDFTLFRVDCRVRVGNQETTISLQSDHSGPSLPFVVISNEESQWMEAEKNLLKHLAFRSNNLQAEIPWPYFANLLQRSFVRSTKQDVASPTRPLHLVDLAYLHSHHFENKASITQNQVITFWRWFGKFLHNLRTIYPLMALWNSGYIYGFISRDDVQAMIAKEPLGNFLISFSEKRSGVLEIAYRRKADLDPTIIQHLMLRPEDLKEIKSLPDYLSEQADLQSVLQWTMKGSGSPSVVSVDKTAAFSIYYSSANNVEPSSSLSAAVSKKKGRTK